MNPKMKSAIEKITLNDATFSNEVIEPTYVNFFYGKNGAGKSTIARTFKANDERLQWQAGKASTDYDVLVYDTDFINANLRNYGNLAGVFTVNESHKVDGDYIKQIFILTHNVYFHKEITHHQAKRYHSVSFYMIRKIENISSVKLCVRQSQRVPTEQENYNPIQNSYAALWDEYKELKTANTVKNVIRHILEYYFIQICGYEGNDLHKIVLEQNKLLFVDEVEGQKPNYDRYNLASSMLTYMNDGPAVISDGFNYIDDGSDVEQCKKVFELIFTAMHQEQHYKMMMGIED